jgi:hypothetical protein
MEVSRGEQALEIAFEDSRPHGFLYDGKQLGQMQRPHPE